MTAAIVTHTAAAAANIQKKPKNNDLTSSSILHTRLHSTPPKIISARGNYLTTAEGTEVFDATGGAAVACIGHNNARVKRAIAEQLETVGYCYSPFFTTDASERLARYLTNSTNGEMARVFIVSSGTEAVEAALKLARQYFVESEGAGTGRCHFIAREQSYHGNTLGSLGVGSHKGRKAIYLPLLAGNFSHVSPCYPYRGMLKGESEEMYVAKLKAELEAEFVRVGPEKVCGFVAETMSGVTLGAVPPVTGYLKAMKEVCDKYGALFILDEVMSGIGRTGTLHAWEQEDVVPHLQTVAKGLGAGYEPIGALLVHKTVVDALSRGSQGFMHSQTYQGHPVACAAAYEVQQIVREEDLLANVQELGPYLGDSLRKRLGEHQHVGDIRGRGFMWGIELVEDRRCKKPFPVERKVAGTLHATGLSAEFGISLLPGGGLADGTNGDLIMLAPAYNITKADVDLIVERTAKVVEHVLGRE
ncbi:pyridoxal phosphate-dependent transferase [Lecanosticta acicola]|uniref:Pyridoxal phosphate-dependent transferase n=1 Tax=Lecanosticta acicola TaxID=111012 RepID=A0AAI8YRQ2_9PEZI|nr:pyridoxal phosphate-dependent transferase [Lecanosticta acicola]